MKIFKNIYFLLAAGILLFSCETEPDLRMPDMQTGFVAYMQILESSDLLVDLTAPDDFNFDVAVKPMWEDPYEKVSLVVVFNRNYENQYIVKDNVTLNQDLSVPMSDIVSVVDELSSAADIVAGDFFQFGLETVLDDGTLIKAFTSGGIETNTSAVRGTIRNVMNGSATVPVLVPCEFDINNFVGSATVTEVFDGDSPEEYACSISLDPDDPLGLIIHDLWWDPPTAFKVHINLRDHSLSAEDQTIWDGDAYGYLGVIAFEDFNAGSMFTCTNTLTFNVTPTLPDPGFWWGGTVTYTVVVGAPAGAPAITEDNKLRPTSKR